jgi:uncharacterized protein (DUF1778 family)
MTALTVIIEPALKAARAVIEHKEQITLNKTEQRVLFNALSQTD